MFQYVKNINEISEKNNIFVVKIETIGSKEELLEVYNKNFKFPYFGYNWDALYDCLCDLSWIEEENIIIAHSTIKMSDHSLRKIYLKILNDVLISWKDDENKKITVFFMEEDKKIISQT